LSEVQAIVKETIAEQLRDPQPELWQTEKLDLSDW
jgi:hypothetical protein